MHGPFASDQHFTNYAPKQSLSAHSLSGDQTAGAWHVGHLAIEKQQDQYVRMLIILKCLQCQRLRRMSPRCECGEVSVEPVVLMAESSDAQRITKVIPDAPLVSDANA